MGNAHFCPVCGDIIGGWDQEVDDDCECVTGLDSNGNVIDLERLVDYTVEQFDFATDAVVEAIRYATSANRMVQQIPVAAVSAFDRARLALSLGRAIEECERFVESYCGPEGEQVRGEAHDC